MSPPSDEVRAAMRSALADVQNRRAAAFALFRAAARERCPIRRALRKIGVPA